LASVVKRPQTEVMRKGPTYVGGFVGSSIGGLLPGLWGAGEMSMSSVAFFVIGGLLGIWLAYRLVV
jgi:hypothetical protein